MLFFFRTALYMEHLDGHFSLAALPYTQMNELLNRTGDRMYSRPHDPPPPPPPGHPLGEIKPPSVIRSALTFVQKFVFNNCTHTNTIYVYRLVHHFIFWFVKLKIYFYATESLVDGDSPCMESGFCWSKMKGMINSLRP